MASVRADQGVGRWRRRSPASLQQLAPTVSDGQSFQLGEVETSRGGVSPLHPVLPSPGIYSGSHLKGNWDPPPPEVKAVIHLVGLDYGTGLREAGSVSDRKAEEEGGVGGGGASPLPAQLCVVPAQKPKPGAGGEGRRR